MTGKELIQWIKDNNAEEYTVVTDLNEWTAVDREPTIKDTSEVKNIYFDSKFKSREKVIFI